MIVGIHSRDNDLVVNAIKEKQLTNMRASGTDENIVLTPPIRFSLEQALSFIESDELVEITPLHIRIRKKFLKKLTENAAKSTTAIFLAQTLLRSAQLIRKSPLIDTKLTIFKILLRFVW